MHGPAAAYVATATRLGWCVQGPLCAITDDGVSLDFCVDSPAFVKAAVDESVRRWRGRNIGRKLAGTDPDGLGLGPNFVSLYRLLDPRRNTEDDEWGPRERAGLRSARTNRQWPQARLCSAGLAESPECQLCVKAQALRHVLVDANVPVAQPLSAVSGTTNGIPRGTLGHRVWECAVTDRQRRRLVSPLLMRA